MRPRCEPHITVIYPLVDVRGHAAGRVLSWTQGQSLDASRYRVIVASAGEAPAEHREVEHVLRPGDELMVVPGANDAALWNAAAARADTRWLVFTEGHCEADAGCLAGVTRWIAANPQAVIGNFEIGHDDGYLGARLADRWFAEMQARWREPDAWPRIHRSGFAIRTDVFAGIGGFEPQYGQFSVPLLSARLHAAGHGAQYVPGARVLHWDDERIRDHHRDTADFVCGEFAARSRCDPVFFERYFGDCAAWRNRRRFEARTAHQVLRALVAACLARPGNAMTLLRLMGSWACEWLAGSRPALVVRRLAVKLDEVVIERLPLPQQWRYSYFVAAHARAVHATQVACIHRGTPEPSAAAGSRWPIEQLDPDALVGMHAIEHQAERRFRWSEPVVIIRGLPTEGELELQIDTGAIRGHPLGYLIAAVAGDRVLPAELLAVEAGTRLILRLPGAWADACREGLVMIVSPLVPSRRGSSDRRRLGMPILSIACRPIQARVQSTKDAA